MADSNKPDDTRPTRADADDVADAIVGFDTRILTTVWDTLVHTPRVLQAAYEGNRERYISIVRMFLILFGLQFAVMAFIGIPTAPTTEALGSYSEESAAEVQAWLAAEGLDQAEVDRNLERAASLTITLLSFLGALPYVLLFKAYRPRRSIYGHVLAYLVTTNASYLVMLPLMALSVFGNVLFWYYLSFTLGLVYYYIVTGRIFASHYATTVSGVIFKTLGVVALLPLTMIVVGLGQYLIAEIVLRVWHDTSFLDLFRYSAEIPSS